MCRTYSFFVCLPTAGSAPAVKTVSINTDLLSGSSAASNRLSLALPGINVVARKWPGSSTGSINPASTLNVTDLAVSTWVGSVVGRAGSWAAFVTAENGGVYGQITVIERRTNKQPTSTVSHCFSGNLP